MGVRSMCVFLCVRVNEAEGCSEALNNAKDFHFVQSQCVHGLSLPCPRNR